MPVTIRIFMSHLLLNRETHSHHEALSSPLQNLERGGGEAYPRSLSALYTFSDVIGRSRMRTPIASSIALAIAAAVGVLGVSPMPLMPYCPRPPSAGTSTVFISGRSRVVGIL